MVIGFSSFQECAVAFTSFAQHLPEGWLGVKLISTNWPPFLTRDER